MGNLFSSPAGEYFSSLDTFCGANRKPDPAEWPLFEEKMKKEGCSDAAINAFKHNYFKLASGADLMISEGSISPSRRCRPTRTSPKRIRSSSRRR